MRIKIYTIMRVLVCITALGGLNSLSSCHAPAELTTTTIKDSIVRHDSIIVRHDTINIKGDSSVVQIQIPCPDANIHESVKHNRETATVDIHKGVLTVDCKEDSLRKVIDIKDSIITWHKTHTVVTNNTKVITEIKAPWWAKICGWFTLIVILLIAGFIAGKYFKIF